MQKFSLGKDAFASQGIVLEQVVIDIDEIQGEDPEKIVRDKAKRAFEAVQRPVIVTDDSWSIPALNGFPGAYGKSMNEWFTADDFLNLMRSKSDRTIYLQQYLAYIDEHEIIVFEKTLPGTLINEPRGKYHVPLMKITCLDHHDGKTIAELQDAGLLTKTAAKHESWGDAARWYAQKVAL